LPRIYDGVRPDQCTISGTGTISAQHSRFWVFNFKLKRTWLSAPPIEIALHYVRSIAFLVSQHHCLHHFHSLVIADSAGRNVLIEKGPGNYRAGIFSAGYISSLASADRKFEI